MKAIIFLALFMVGLVFGQNQHVDTTAVTLGEVIVPEGGEHFLVAIDHIEDEIDINGVVLAERGVHVALQFDIVENQQVVLNGVPVSFGYSELQVGAVLYEIDVDGQPSPFDQIVSIDVRIFVGARLVQMENGWLSGIVIQERVVGIQEKEVWQATVKEQVLVVRADGSVQKFEEIEVELLQGEVVEKDQAAPASGEKKPHHGHGHHGHHGHGGQMNPVQGETPVVGEDSEMGPPQKTHGKCVSKYWRKFMTWFHSLPFYLRVLVSFAGGLILGFTGIAIVRCICCTFCRKNKKCSWSKSKEENYKANIHLYSLQYTAVPQDEKAAEKKAVENV